MRLRQQRLADLAPPEVVSNLPVKVFFNSKAQENDPMECVICLEDYKDEDELRVLPCKHEYHVACIDNWLTNRKKFCPICKRDICAPTERTPLLAGASPSQENSHQDNSAASSIPTSIPGPSSSRSPLTTSRSGATGPPQSEHDDQGSRTSASGSSSSTFNINPPSEDEVLRRV